MSQSLWSRELQNARLLCPWISPRACSNSCHGQQSVMLPNHLILCFPLLLLPSILPSIRVFSNESALHIRWPKYWNFSISPSNIQGWFLLGLTSLISLLSKGLTRAISSTTIQKHQFFDPQPSLWSKFHIHNWKTIDLTRWIFVSKVMSLLFNTLCRFVLAFLPRSKCLLISWLQPLSAVTLEPKKRKSVTVSTFPFSVCHEVIGLVATLRVAIRTHPPSSDIWSNRCTSTQVVKIA